MALLALSLEGILGWTCMFCLIGLLIVGHVISQMVGWFSGSETAQEIAKEVGTEVAGSFVEDIINNLFGK